MRLWDVRVVCVGLLLLIAPAVPAQQDNSSTPSNTEGETGPTVRSSTVGYIDTSIPGNVVRFRYDSAYRSLQPARSEFIYALPGPRGPGLARGEPRIDYQDVTAYFEYAFTPRLSAFVETPFRFGNFVVNPNHAGFSDVTAGLKYAWIYTDCTVASTQLRVFAPTGDERLGLGTGHASIEPAFLLYRQLSDRLASESELRLWVPLGGTENVAGEVLRYGTGLRYDVYRSCAFTVAPVTEVVGWTFLSGQNVGGTPENLTSASGDTVVNVKSGVRFKMDAFGDIYAGYGRAVTGDVLYKDMIRLELRILY